MKIKVMLEQIIEFPSYIENEAELMAFVDMDYVSELSSMEDLEALQDEAQVQTTRLLSAELYKEAE